VEKGVQTSRGADEQEKSTKKGLGLVKPENLKASLTDSGFQRPSSPSSRQTLIKNLKLVRGSKFKNYNASSAMI
jgi:hypothetical protein